MEGCSAVFFNLPGSIALIPLSAILKRTGGSMCSINGILYHDRGRLVDEAVLERMRAV